MKLINKGLLVEAEEFIKDQKLESIEYGIYLPTTGITSQNPPRLHAYILPSKRRIQFLEVVQHERDNYIYLALWDFQTKSLVDCSLRLKFLIPKNSQIIASIKLASQRLLKLEAIRAEKNIPTAVEGPLER